MKFTVNRSFDMLRNSDNPKSKQLIHFARDLQTNGLQLKYRTLIRCPTLRLLQFLFTVSLAFSVIEKAVSQSSLSYISHSRTSFTVAGGADLSLLTQVDMARMLPVQKSIRQSRELDVNGAYSTMREVLFVSGNDFMTHEVGHITTADDSGVTTRNALGDTILHLAYDGDYWNPDTNVNPIVLQSLFTDPFAGLDSMIGTMPPGMITHGPGYVTVVWPGGDQTTYYPEYLIVKHEIHMEDSTVAKHAIRYLELDGGVMVPLKEVKETPLRSEYGLCISEKIVTDYAEYIVDTGNQGELRQSAVVMKNEDLHLFPNPVHDLLQVSANWAEGQSQITVYSVDGREVLSQYSRADKDRYVLQVGGLPPGAYLLRIVDDAGQVRTSRFIRR